MFTVPISNQFAKLLEDKQQRENRYISLAEVSDKTGVSRKTLYKWERNTIEHFNRDVIEKLCEYFGVEMNELLIHTPNKKAPRK